MTRIDRRTFAILAVGFCTVAAVDGCGKSQQDIATLALTLTDAVATVASLEGNSDLATKLRVDGKAAATAIAAWKSGTPAQDAIQAINLVIDDLNLIPGTDQYAPLIDIALVTAESLLALLPQPLAPRFIAGPPVIAHQVRSARTATAKVKAPKTSREFAKQWNAVVAKNPALAPAVISK